MVRKTPIQPTPRICSAKLFTRRLFLQLVLIRWLLAVMRWRKSKSKPSNPQLFHTVAVVRRARIHTTELFRVTLIVVVLTARGLGTPGVRARDAACRNKPERCVLHETQAVEEQCVPLFETKRKTATLACKLLIFCLLAFPRRFYLNIIHTLFLFLWAVPFRILCFSFYGPKEAV